MTVVTQNKIDILVGMIAPFAMDTPPSGWLACDGSTNVSKTAYADLYNALTANDTIPNPWGSGDDSTKFAIPDLEGAFLRGTGSHPTSGTYKKADGSAFTGPSVGSFENDQIQQFRSELRKGGQATTGTGTTGSLGYSNPTGGSSIPVGTLIEDGYGTPRSGDETRPFNAGVKYCIKY